MSGRRRRLKCNQASRAIKLEAVRSDTTITSFVVARVIPTKSFLNAVSSSTSKSISVKTNAGRGLALEAVDRIDEKISFGIHRAAEEVILADEGLGGVRPQFVERGVAGVLAAAVCHHRDHVFLEAGAQPPCDGGLGFVHQVGVTVVGEKLDVGAVERAARFDRLLWPTRRCR